MTHNISHNNTLLRGCLDIDLKIGYAINGEYPVEIINSPVGQARSMMRFIDQIELERYLDDLQQGLPAKDFGSALFAALFTGEVEKTYYRSCDEARRQNKRLRLRLRGLPSELTIVPWELLYESHQRDFICFSRSISIIRYLELAFPAPTLTVKLPLRILIMGVNPSDLEELEVERERQVIEEATRELQNHGLIELTWLAGQGWRDLQKAMLNKEWHIFHFIGHGGYDKETAEGCIALGDEDDKADYFSATKLARLLGNNRALRLVVLNSCEGTRGDDADILSSVATTLVAKNVPAVVAMQFAIGDQAATEFSRSFYEVLVTGIPVDEAMSIARQSVSFAGCDAVDWGAPVLYMRSDDGVLFNIQRQENEDATGECSEEGNAAVEISILSWLAYEMYVEKTTGFPRERARREIAECLRNNNFKIKYSADQFLARLIDKRKLQQAQDDQICFREDIQRDYYLANYLQKLFDEIPYHPIEGLSDNAIIYLSTMLNNPAEIVDPLVLERPALAARCIEAGADIGKETMLALIKRIVPLLENESAQA